jgi:acyl carrier protein
MYEELKKLLVEEMQIKEADITPEARLVENLGFNSLELADLVVMCEDNYDITFDEDEAKNLTTVGEVAAYVEKLVSEK